MATLVAIGYPDQGTAEQARDTVSKLEAELVIQADQVAAISRDMEGKYATPVSGTSPGTGGPFGAVRPTCVIESLRLVEPRPGASLESADDRPAQRAVRRSADG